MRAASIYEIKRELQTQPPAKVLEYCLRLAKFKKENKELLTYLLFEAHNEDGYILSIKAVIEELFDGINLTNLYWTKKGLRKTLRQVDKFVKYSDKKRTEVELRIYYCQLLKKRMNYTLSRSRAIANLYQRQIQRILKAISGLHEDLQYDYKLELEEKLQFKLNN